MENMGKKEIKIEDDIEYKQISRVRKKRRKKHYLLRFLVFIAVCAGIYYFLQSDYFAVKTYSVKGNKYYTDSEILAMAKASPGRNIIFKPGIKEIRDNLLQDPYFEDVQVSRTLPSKMTITVMERSQTAAIPYGNIYLVIDSDGMILRKTDVPPELTLLSGLTISKMDVGELIEVEEKDTLSMTLRMVSAMYKGDIFFKKIDMSKVVVKAYIYDTLIVKGTPAEIMNSIESKELQKVVSNLFKNSIVRGTIKMGGSEYMSFSPGIEDD